MTGVQTCALPILQEKFPKVKISKTDIENEKKINVIKAFTPERLRELSNASSIVAETIKLYNNTMKTPSIQELMESIKTFRIPIPTQEISKFLYELSQKK